VNPLDTLANSSLPWASAKLAAGEVGAGAEAFCSVRVPVRLVSRRLRIIGRTVQQRTPARSAQNATTWCWVSLAKPLSNGRWRANEDLDTLTVRLGSTAASTQNAAITYSRWASAGIAAEGCDN
jgi:hypothetical protein